MLQAIRNKYGGVFVSGRDLPEENAQFRVAMAIALSAWAREDLKLAWLEIPARRGELLPDALDLGFKLHHSRGETLMLVRRLIDGAYIPDACTHSIGAGGLVLSEDRQILVVLEKRDRIERPEHLKLPGGMLERREHLAEAAVREVFEETGIRTQFRGLIGMRHHHRAQFGASNIYAVCHLSPLSFDIHIDGDELEKALWMPIEEYLAREATSPFNRRVVEAAVAADPLSSVNLDNYMDHPDDYEIFMPDAGDRIG